MRRICRNRGGPTALACILGHSNGSYLAQLAQLAQLVQLTEH